MVTELVQGEPQWNTENRLTESWGKRSIIFSRKTTHHLCCGGCVFFSWTPTGPPCNFRLRVIWNSEVLDLLGTTSFVMMVQIRWIFEVFPVVDVVSSFCPSGGDFPLWGNAKMWRLLTCDCQFFPGSEWLFVRITHKVFLPSLDCFYFGLYTCSFDAQFLI